MKPQLPPDDLKLIETVKVSQEYFLKQFPDAKSILSYTHTEELLSIISRLQKALDKCVEQRDEIALSIPYHDRNDYWLKSNQELQKILNERKD